jgi:hypothetical protein
MYQSIKSFIMKTKQITFLIEQVLIILVVCFLLLIQEGFIYKASWKSTFIFSLAFFHIGTFASLYLTFVSKTWTPKKEGVFQNFNFFVYLGFISLCLYHNCLIQTDHLPFHYFFGLFTLSFSIVFLFETYFSYIKYKTSLFINTKTSES